MKPFKPPVDHTNHNNASYYMLAQALPGMYQDYTQLKTGQPIGETSETCMLFVWYWINGPEVGSLAVLKENLRGDLTEIIRLEGNSGSLWNQAIIHLGHLTVDHVIVEARRGISYLGVIAVDDIELYDCDPPTKPDHGKCDNEGKFDCSNGLCISMHRVCDFSNDCYDGSDETQSVCAIYNNRCNFETGLCLEWIEEDDDDLNWSILQPTSVTEGIYPNYDHTLGTNEGHYLTLGGKGIIQQNQIARLHSPVIKAQKLCTLRIWFYLSNENPGIINIYRRHSYLPDGMVLIASYDQFYAHAWWKETINVDKNTTIDYQIVIEGIVGNDTYGHISMDDLSMTPTCQAAENQVLPGEGSTTTLAPHSCPSGLIPCSTPGQCYQPIQRCNFKDDCGDGTDEAKCTKSCDWETEGDLCNWNINQGSSILWKRSSFPADPPGPPTDHSNLSNTHDLVAASEGAGGEIAILNSNIFSSVSLDCNLTLWYYIFAVGSVDVYNSITIYKKAYDTNSHEVLNELLFLYMGDKDVWQSVPINLSGDRDFSISIQAHLGDGKTHVAIDDLKFINCEPKDHICETYTDFQCEDGSCVPIKYRCDAKYDCPDKSDENECPDIKGNCNFDSNDWLISCGWRQETVDDIDFKREQTGHHLVPSHDHTLGYNGYFIYIENDKSEMFQAAELVTKHIYPPTPEVCFLRYWYFIKPQTDGATLTVYIQDLDGRRVSVGFSSGSKDPEWIEQIILLASTTEFKVVFLAMLGGTEDSFIAIDDVSFTEECQTGVGPSTPTGGCEIGEKKCNDGQCIPEGFFCDCFIDCIDGSDENNCENVTCTTIGRRTTPTYSSTTTSNSDTSVSTEVTATSPSACSDTQFSCGGNPGVCIPSLLLCDGVSDCPGEDDENNCPKNTPCDPDYIYCGDPMMSSHPCLQMDSLCDGYAECDALNADESVCGVCPKGYCLHEGKCTVSQTGPPLCSCTNKYYGNRCERRSPNTGMDGGAIAGIVIGVIIGCVILIVIIIYIVKHSRLNTERHRLFLNETTPHYGTNHLPMERIDDHNASRSSSIRSSSSS